MIVPYYYNEKLRWNRPCMEQLFENFVSYPSFIISCYNYCRLFVKSIIPELSISMIGNTIIIMFARFFNS